MKDLGKTRYCLGLQIEYCLNGVLIHQSSYTKKVLKRFYMDKSHPLCDAPFPGGPLTTRQHTEYSWKSGNPTPLTKIRQSLLCTGSSTQGTTCPKFSQRPHRVHIQFKMSKNGHLGPCINTHKIHQLYTIV